MTMHSTPQADYVQRLAPDTIRIERLLPGPVERVWSYLVESEKRGQWLASGSVEQKAGGCAEHVFRNSDLTRNDDPAPAKYAREAGEIRFEVEVLACEPNKLLAHTWPDGSEVRFELKPQGKEVLLTVTHSRIAERGPLLSVSAGWHTHLDILAARLAGREPAGFWRTHTRLEAEYGRLFD